MTVPAHSDSHPSISETRRDVRRVLLITLLLNLAVSFSKIAIGTVSGSLSIVADGFHSLMDGASNVVALLANWLAARPPDEVHPYGHRRFETLAALGIGMLLLLTAFELVSSAIERLGASAQPNYTPLTFAIMIATLLINLFVAWYERREGLRLNSVLLIADSAHTASDVLVTISVLVSMVLTQLGLTWADSVTALIVVVLIGRTALAILRQTGGVLADAAPITADALKEAAQSVPAADGHVVRARSRGPADSIYVDIDVEVPAATTTERTEAITAAIRKSLEAQFDGIDEVEVHFVPDKNGETDPALLARSLADPLALSVHEVRLIRHDGQQALELHVEVPPGSTLEQAHEQVTALEAALREQMPALSGITTHIEPAAPPTPSDEPDPADADAIQAAAVRLLTSQFPECDWHDVHVTEA
ncbi:MAG TPA: cation-efflux pump, partial [Candidatus Limnocylindrales bacterium]|nr:cation-efflux pump [Candidatus Limnocylindrales bacterium]